MQTQALVKGFKVMVIAGALLFALPAFADETASSTPSTNTSTPNQEIEIPTSTPPVETPSSTPTTTPNLTLATTTINLSVITSQESFVFPNLLVTACPEVDNSTVFTLNAMCALQQSGLTIEWSTFGTDMFLNAIESYANNWETSVFWNWFNDLNYGMTALNKHILTSNEDLLLTYDQLPLKINTSSSTPEIGTTTTITVEQFGFDGFAPVWNLAASSTLSINNTLVSNDTGTYSLFITSTDPIEVFGTKPGFIPSAALTIFPTSTLSSTTTENNTNTTGNGSGSGSGNSNQNISQDTITQTVEKLINFIKANQDTSGKIIDGPTSDWLAMSFGAYNIYTASVQNSSTSLYNYIYNYNISELDNELNNCTAYPRHILALLASGISKTDTKVNSLKAKMDACVENNSFGANGINDDVFGLISALAIGESHNSAIVQTTLAALLANQQPDGGFAYPGPFESPDLTGAALNALKYAQNSGLAVDSAIFTKAKAYLKSQQLTDGGWGFGTSDALTTSWAVMGINALGEGQTNWFTTTGKNPWHVLTTLNNDHYTQTWDGNTDWFATKHAIPALLGKSWPIILSSISQPVSGSSGPSVNTDTSPSTSTEVISIIPTTTTALATTTPATSTIEIITIVQPEEDIYGEILGIKIENQANETTIEELFGKEKSPAVLENTSSAETTATATPQNNPTLVEDLANNEGVDTPTKRDWAKKILLISLAGILIIGLLISYKALKHR